MLKLGEILIGGVVALFMVAAVIANVNCDGLIRTGQYVSPVAAAGALFPENFRRITVSGGIKVSGVKFQIGSNLAGTLVTIVRDNTTIAFYSVSVGALLIERL